MSAAGIETSYVIQNQPRLILRQCSLHINLYFTAKAFTIFICHYHIHRLYLHLLIPAIIAEFTPTNEHTVIRKLYHRIAQR